MYHDERASYHYATAWCRPGAEADKKAPGFTRGAPFLLTITRICSLPESEFSSTIVKQIQ
jgi:hypothetical protein